MVGLMKRRRRTSRGPDFKLRPRGFDYGCLPYVAAIASVDFIGHLNAAVVDAIAYGSAWSGTLDKEVPVISLVAQRGNELVKAFEEFSAWSQMTDPDSVAMSFVFRKNGGYLLAISPEYSRLQRRCLGFDRAHRAFVLGPTWIKPIDSINPLLQAFRKYCSAPIAPFLLDGVTYVGPRSVLTPRSSPDVRPIPSLKPLQKFEVTFVDEDEATPNSMAWLALRAESGNEPESPTGPPKLEPDGIAKQRTRALAQHFPVTLERMRRESSVQRLMRGLAEYGVRPWQIEQALCNLVLSAEMGRGAHFAGLSAREAENGIIQAIRTRYELADGGELPAYSTEDVSTQVVADGNVLLRHLAKKRRANLAGLQAALRSLSALEADTAVDPPAEWSASS